MTDNEIFALFDTAQASSAVLTDAYVRMGEAMGRSRLTGDDPSIEAWQERLQPEHAGLERAKRSHDEAHARYVEALAAREKDQS